MFPSRRRRRRLDDSNSRRNQHAAEQRDTSPRQDVSPCESETAMPDVWSIVSVDLKYIGSAQAGVYCGSIATLHSDFRSSTSSGDSERSKEFPVDFCRDSSDIAGVGEF